MKARGIEDFSLPERLYVCLMFTRLLIIMVFNDLIKDIKRIIMVILDD